jgi:hypothetical protein
MASKEIKIGYTETGITAYCIIKREADGFLLDDADGAFVNAPADPYLSLSEHGTIKGLYEVSESRTVWNDGRYSILAYKQSGGSPVPASDFIIGNGDMYALDDAEVVLDDSVATITAKTDSLTFTGTDVQATLDGEKVDLQTATQNSIDAIETDTNEIQTKLPTNNIMGSSVKTDKDDEIDAIKAVTDILPNAGALTDIDTGVNNLESRLTATRAGYLDNLSAGAVALEATLTAMKGVGWVNENLTTINTIVNAIELVTDNLPDSGTLTSIAQESTLTTHDTDIKALLNSAVYGLSALKVLIDAVQTDLDNPDQYKADVSSLALEATLTAIKGVGWMSETLKAIKDAIDTGTVDTAAIADAVWDEAISGHTTATTFGGKNQKVVPSESVNDYKADISALAIEANVETHVTNSLSSYDPPTRTEATADKAEIIVQVNANETKIDTMTSDLQIVKGLLHSNVKYTSPAYDSDGNLTSVVITIYTDNTLVTPITSFTWAATGAGSGKFTVAQQTEN